MANQIKFVRIHGRVVPMHDKTGLANKRNDNRLAKQNMALAKKHASPAPKAKKPGDSIHFEQARMGAASGLAAGLSFHVLNAGYKKAAVGVAAAGLGIGLTALYKNVKNSFEHGNKKKSFWHGVGRHVTNSLASGVGHGVGRGITGSGF